MIADELRTLWNLARGQPRRGTHAERLQAFYAPQAAHYDRFRARLLAGREELIERLPVREGARVVELGAGTGRNAESFGARLVKLERLELVDLCPALLEQARERAKRLPNVVAIEADATRYRPAAPADCAYFSYSLSMIPDWRAAIDNAVAMLRPGGTLGAVDFHLPPDAGPLERRFWTLWFARSGVRPSAEHLRYLRARLDQDYLREWRAPLPYLPGVRAPVYLFVGRRRERAR
ncbi:MAG: methyltransferase domain-containing protein [Burkholderiales bacterium]